LLRATSCRQAKEEWRVCARRHSVADAPPPGGTGTHGCVSSGAGLLSLSVEAKRAVPLLQNETQNMNTTENLISTACPAPAPQPANKIVKPFKFPAQPQEWKIVSLRECPTPDTLQQCDTPDKAAAYWKAHIPGHPYFNPDCECLVVFILNTRRRIKGHYLVSIGTMDTILCHPREIYRLAIMAGAAAIILAHNLCGAPHKLCYVTRRFMCSHASGVLKFPGLQERKECHA
jgi:hypothetical protein